MPGAGGGDAGGDVTVGYASHSCRGRRTESNRRRSVARFFLATVRPALPFPFPSSFSLFLSPSLFFSPFSLSLSFALSAFPFLFVLSSRPRHRRWPWPWPEVCERKRERERERNISSCRSSHTFQGVPHVRRDTSVCSYPATRNRRVLSLSRASRLIIRRRSLGSLADVTGVIKGYVA